MLSFSHILAEIQQKKPARERAKSLNNFFDPALRAQVHNITAIHIITLADFIYLPSNAHNRVGYV